MRLSLAVASWYSKAVSTPWINAFKGPICWRDFTTRELWARSNCILAMLLVARDYFRRTKSMGAEFAFNTSLCGVKLPLAICAAFLSQIIVAD
jgi:hypothetical protein